MPKEQTGHSKHPLPTTQEMTLHTNVARWSIPKLDWLYPLQPRRRSSIQTAKIRLGADCGSDHELLTETFRLKLKKVGKTTRPFRYELNQINYDYTVEVTNRFKGLDLLERLPEELWMEVHTLYRRLWSKPSPRGRNTKKAKWLSEEALQIAKKRKEVKGKGGKIYPSECRVPKNSKER